MDAVIGVYDWERETEQSLIFSIDMVSGAASGGASGVASAPDSGPASGVARAAASDDIADALDYSVIAATVRTVVTEGRFRLIETAAERVAARLLAGHGLSWVRVKVAKPLPREGYTAVITIERSA